MNTKLKAIILGAFTVSAISLAHARTPIFSFNQDVLISTEFWDIWTTSPTLGTASADIYNWGAQTDDQLQMGGGSYDVSVKISGNFVQGHPNSTVFNNAIFNNLKLEIAASSIFTKNINFIFNANTHVVYNATSATQTTGGYITMNNGTSSLIFNSGTNYINTNGSTTIGAASGYQKVEIIGSTSSIQFRNFTLAGATTDKSSIVGGHLIFVADAGGISTLSILGGGGSLTGIIEIDFTDFDWEIYGSDTGTFKLMSTNENLSARLQTWIDSDLAIIVGADLMSWTTDSSGLYVSLSRQMPVPEPSAYAAVFGALALAFVAYRRRK